MKILMHQCCAPCSIYTSKILRENFETVYGFFYNPNIHPVTEFYKRLESVSKFNDKNGIKSIIDEHYGLAEFTRNVVYREDNRCRYCYASRIEKSAQIASKGKFDYFTTSLLYSKFQNHDLIAELCETAAKKYNTRFFYYDFREGWKDGIEKSKEMDMYRQQYCGCIYSEEDRYRKQLSKRFNNSKIHEKSGKV